MHLSPRSPEFKSSWSQNLLFYLLKLQNLKLSFSSINLLFLIQKSNIYHLSTPNLYKNAPGTCYSQLKQLETIVTLLMCSTTIVHCINSRQLPSGFTSTSRVHGEQLYLLLFLSPTLQWNKVTF